MVRMLPDMAAPYHDSWRQLSVTSICVGNSRRHLSTVRSHPHGAICIGTWPSASHNVPRGISITCAAARKRAAPARADPAHADPGYHGSKPIPHAWARTRGDPVCLPAHATQLIRVDRVWPSLQSEADDLAASLEARMMCSSSQRSQEAHAKVGAGAGAWVWE